MEISSAVYTLAGSIFAASVAGLVAFKIHREGVIQQRREQLLKIAFDAASVEYGAHIDIWKIDKNGAIPAYFKYLIFNIAFIHQMLGGDDSVNLDESTIRSARERARKIRDAAG